MTSGLLVRIACDVTSALSEDLEDPPVSVLMTIPAAVSRNAKKVPEADSLPFLGFKMELSGTNWE